MVGEPKMGVFGYEGFRAPSAMVSNEKLDVEEFGVISGGYTEGVSGRSTTESLLAWG